MKHRSKTSRKDQVHVGSTAAPDPKAYNRILNLFHTSRFNEAAQAIGAYLSRYSKDADAWNLRAMISRSLLHYEQAVEFMEEALRIEPRNATFWNNLGAVLKDKGDIRAAVDAFQQALKFNPYHADSLYNLGYTYHHLGEYDRARTYYQRSLSIRPNHQPAIENLVTLDKEQGNLQQAIQGYQAIIQKQPENLYSWSNMLSCMNYIDTFSAEDVFQAHLDFGRYFENLVRPTAEIERHPFRSKKLRIGFVSSDFRTHSIAFFLMPLLNGRDRHGFECYAYSSGNFIDETTRTIQRLMDQWRNIFSVSAEDVADQIRADQIDILVDLSGHTGYNRLDVFLRKPAPIQVTWLGYPNTTGLSRMDYRITDAYTDPEPYAESFHTEQLVRLPHGFLCYQPPTDIPECNALPARTTGQITFGSFNNHVKISPSTVRIWSRVLQRVEGSRLMLKSSFPIDSTTKERLMASFHAAGIASDRIVLLDKLPLMDHFLAYHRIDIALDTIPYNGTTTTLESLYMGVPVLALEGDRHAARVSAGILARLGLTDWIAHSEDAYVDLAVKKASDLQALSQLRMDLRSRMRRSPLMDRFLFVAEMQDAFRWMWRQYCDDVMKDQRKVQVVLIASMHPDDAQLMAETAEALALSEKPGTKIEGIRVEYPKDWHRLVEPLLHQPCESFRMVVVQCRIWMQQALELLKEPYACGFYVHRHPHVGQFDQLDGDECQPQGWSDLLVDHNRWMQSVPWMTVFRRKDWETRPSVVIGWMARRMGIDVSEDTLSRLENAVNTRLQHTGKGKDQMGFDRSYTFSIVKDTVVSETVSQKTFRLMCRMEQHGLLGKSFGLVEGYDHPDVEDCSFGDHWWISFPKENDSPETLRIKVCRDEPEPEQVLLQQWFPAGGCGVDMGSGWGLHTMTAAQAAGPNGTIWSFETDPSRWSCSMRSIAISSMHQVRLVRACIGKGSDRMETASIATDPIPCFQLDQVMHRFDMSPIDWIRIGDGVDTVAVLDGGWRCFSENSPLVQVVKQQDEASWGNVLDRLKGLGYQPYRIAPGLGCLVPCSESHIQSLKRDLFCCKPDRAAKMAIAGLLVRREIDMEATGRSHPSLWLDHLRTLPYAIRLIHLWERYLTAHLRDPAWRVHQEAMSCYALSCMPQLPMEDRWQALGRAHRLLIDLLSKHASFSRLMTMARVASEMGYDDQAVEVLKYLANAMESGDNVSIDEPFLLPVKRLDRVDPGEEIGGMVLTAIFEGLERAENRLGQWRELANQERIELLRTLPFYDTKFEDRRRAISLDCI